MRRLSREVREVLVCPRCHGELEDAENPLTKAAAAPAAAEIVGFTCASCRVIYPVEEGIPVLLVDAAREQESPGN